MEGAMDDIMMGDDDQEMLPQPTRHAGPRLYHKKSRMGCSRCKARRVKCDEAKPSCGGCSRHQVECVYPAMPTTGVNALPRGIASGSRLVQPAETQLPGGVGSGSSNIDLWVTHHDSASSMPSEQDHSPYAAAAAAAATTTKGLTPNSSVDSWTHTSPAPANTFLSVSHDQSAAVSPARTSAHSSASSLQSPSMPASPTQPTWDYHPAPSGHRGHSNRSQSVASNSSSSHTGGSSSAVHEANDYLSSLTDPETLEIPESRERRMWELRLMHNYMSNQAQQFARAKATAFHGQQPTPGVALTDEDVDPKSSSSRNVFGQFVWGRDMPRLAFENDSILYNLLASSALEMWTRSTDPHERDQLRLLQQKYIAMALRQQRLAVGNLGRDNADMVCMAALTILLNSFALVQTLDLTPWQPPLDWLRMGKGAGAVLTIATGYIGASGDERIRRFVESGPKMDPAHVYAPENRTHLSWLLENDRGSTTNVGDFELETSQAPLEIYNRVLSYIGSVQKGIADREPIFMVCRRLIGFAIYCPELYHDFLGQRRPRALITLAHFFKLWIPYDDLWLIGSTGENQVRGIYETLPPEWKHKVEPIFDEYNLER